jgi:hypothetical protein
MVMAISANSRILDRGTFSTELAICGINELFSHRRATL